MTQLPTRRLRLLGPVRVNLIPNALHTAVKEEVGERLTDEIPRFRSKRTVALLGYLAVERRPVSRQFLAALLWPDWTPARGRANLRRDLHNLAQILPECWELDRQTVAFVPATNAIVDLYQLLQLEAEARWGEAADLLGGEFLEGVYLEENPEFENWLQSERERWRARSETVLTHVVEGHSRRGRYVDALTNARRLLQLTPWNEETHVQVMRLLAWTGQRGAALRQFEISKHTLWEELGIQPSAETTALYQQIQSGNLDLPPQLPAYLTDEKARHEFEQPLFVARERELAQLDAWLDQVLVGQSRVVFINGGPGRGKTALLNAFAQRAMDNHPKLLVASGKCNAYSGLGDPYLPYRDVVAMLTGDVEARWDAGTISRDHARRLWDALPFATQALLDHGPQLLDVFVSPIALLSRAMAAGKECQPWLLRLREHLKHQETISMDVEKDRLFQQVVNVLGTLSQEQPLLLILDDLQWADAPSIDLLFHLGRRFVDFDSRVLIACAYRPEEVTVGRGGKRHPLAKPLSEFKRTFGDVFLYLGRVDQPEGRRFVDALLDSERNRLGERFRVALFDRTGGHPLFTVELLHAMQERGELLVDEAGYWVEGPTLAWEVLPARVEAVIEERLDRLDADLRDILTIASVEGEVFTAEVVAEVRKVSERTTIRQLSHELERQHNLVREQEEIETRQKRMSRYRFGHILYQDYLYQGLGRGEKRLLHREIAEALKAQYEGQLDEIAVQLAQHFLHANDHEQDFYFSSLAAERAARIYESGEAINYYTRALQLADRISPDVDSLTKLHRGRGLALEKMGAFDQANSDHFAALQMAQAAGKLQVAWRAFLDLGRLWSSRDHNQAGDYFESALELAGRLDDSARLAASLNWMGNWYTNDGNFRSAVANHREAQKIFEDLGDQRELADTLDLLGIANLMGGDLIACVECYDQSIAICRELDERPRLASSLMGRASSVSMLVIKVSVSVTLTRPPSFDIEEALRIAKEVSLTSEEVWAHWSMGLLYIIQGHFGQALEVLQNGMRIASKFGHREWVVGVQFSLGILYIELFAPDQALDHLEEALKLARELQSPMWIHLVSGALTGAYFVVNDLNAAQDCLETVISQETPMDTLGKRYCWARRAELAVLQDNPKLALDITNRLIATAPGMQPDRIITFLWMLKGEALTTLGHLEEAHTLICAARENAHNLNERFLLGRIYASLGRLYTIMKYPTEASKEFSAARTLIEELAATIPDEALKSKFVQHAGTLIDLL